MARKSREALPPMGENYGAGQLTPSAMTKLEFARRLHALIIEKEWNQSDLARAAGVGRDSISKYVNGISFPTPQIATRIAKAFGMERSELLPNSLQSALDDEHPAVELKQAAGHLDKAWLRINRAVSFNVGALIVDILNKADQGNDAALERARAGLYTPPAED